MKIFLIALFGAIGTLARYGLQGVVQLRMGSLFPYGTLLISAPKDVLNLLVLLAAGLRRPPCARLPALPRHSGRAR